MATLILFSGDGVKTKTASPVGQPRDVPVKNTHDVTTVQTHLLDAPKKHYRNIVAARAVDQEFADIVKSKKKIHVFYEFDALFT